MNPRLLAESWAKGREEGADSEGMQPGAVAVYWRDWRLIHRGSESEDELYNLRTDPHEASNLMIQPAAAAIAVAQLLAGAASPEWQDKGPRTVPETNTKTRERLRALGYID